ncbi:hypothetical protein PITCH_A1820011 [uncultured Desulfobacterium sp.]|uniref:Uncharacterized protein n=1 Tax=uncultured Desulfobacterium sp. TaxID=201089 RepID=A0A445MVG2_9BACT|nr:hypothetical protein PITCH_A1820011 [uncultured Desulfobacterium sp.]
MNNEIVIFPRHTINDISNAFREAVEVGILLLRLGKDFDAIVQPA